MPNVTSAPLMRTTPTSTPLIRPTSSATASAASAPTTIDTPCPASWTITPIASPATAPTDRSRPPLATIRMLTGTTSSSVSTWRAISLNRCGDAPAVDSILPTINTTTTIMASTTQTASESTRQRVSS